jgi:hypothetical protein
VGILKILPTPGSEWLLADARNPPHCSFLLAICHFLICEPNLHKPNKALGNLLPSPFGCDFDHHRPEELCSREYRIPSPIPGRIDLPLGNFGLGPL